MSSVFNSLADIGQLAMYRYTFNYNQALDVKNSANRISPGQKLNELIQNKLIGGQIDKKQFEKGKIVIIPRAMSVQQLADLEYQQGLQAYNQEQAANRQLFSGNAALQGQQPPLADVQPARNDAMNMEAFSADQSSYVASVKRVLTQVQDSDDKIKIAKSAKRALKRKSTPATYTDISPQDIVRLLQSEGLDENVALALQGASVDVLRAVSLYFKIRNGKIVYKKPDAETRKQIASSAQARVGRRIAKMLNARRQLRRISARSLTGDYITKRSNISKAARTGSASVMIQKYNRGLKKYGKINPEEVLTSAKKALAEGLTKTQTNIETKMNAGAKTLTEFGQGKYNTYKQVLNENRIVSDTLDAADKTLFGLQ